jgi:hypothetical protein
MARPIKDLAMTTNQKPTSKKSAVLVLNLFAMMTGIDKIAAQFDAPINRSGETLR